MPFQKKITRFRHLGVAALAITIILLAVNAVGSYLALNTLVNNEIRASTTKSVLRSIKDFYSAVQDAELGLRGFLLSGQESYLTPYYNSLDDIAIFIDELKQYDYEVPQQRERLIEIEHLVSERLEEMADDVSQKRQGSDTFRISKQKLRDSHTSISKLYAIIHEMENEEYVLLTKQSAIAAGSRDDLRLTIIIANSIGLLLVCGVTFLVRYVINLLQEEASKLEDMVAVRTEALNHYTNELQRSNRELQDFAFVASHDLQEPLRKIRAFGDRLKSDYSRQLGDGADYLTRMQNAAARMSKLIEDLLIFSRVSTRGNPFEEVDLNEVIADVLENLELSVDEKQARIDIDEMPVIESDPSQMRQLFQNLLGNALKFVVTDRQPSISIKVQESDGTSKWSGALYDISVIDNGIGFDERYKEKIFTPFQRLHGKDQYAGTGIGLAICRRIVERHKGQIDVHSTPGEGTCFTMRIPRYQTDPLTYSADIAQETV